MSVTFLTDVDKAELQEQIDASKESNDTTDGLTTEQVNALDGMFKVCAFIKEDISAEYEAFKAAFGLTESGGEEPEQPESGIVQIGSLLAITSGVTANKKNSVLEIA